MKFSLLLQYVTPRRRTLVFIVLLLLAGTTVNLLNPLIAGKLTGVLLAEPGHADISVGLILAVWLILLIVRAILTVSSNFLVGYTGAEMSAELRSRVYEHMQILPLGWLQERKQGDVLSLLSTDAQTISNFVTSTLVQLLPQILTLVFAFLVMAWLDPVIAIAAALLLPAYAIVAKLIGRRIRPLSSAWMHTWSGLLAFVNENLGLMPALKAFNREPLESQRFARRNQELLTISRRQIWLTSLISPTIGLMAGGGALLLLWIGARQLNGGQLQPSELVTLLFYVMLLTTPLSALASVYGQFMHARGAAGRLLEFFAEQPEPIGQGTDELGSVRGSIEFRDISYAYPNRPLVLENFSLKINAGETIAITGPNGSGKSTLVHLLMWFMEPGSGQVLIDDTDIQNASMASLRQQIGLVAQHTLLLNGTIAENIAYALPDSNMATIKKAAKTARAEEFIEALPEGYNTVIGDQGIKLSGGQRQRLSLARAILKDPPILILDEATAMFDPQGEKEFIEECKKELKKRTVILITHRAASLALADRTISMDPN